MTNQERALLGLPLLVRVTKCCFGGCDHVNLIGQIGELQSTHPALYPRGEDYIVKIERYGQLRYAEIEYLE